jgi:hypothetical protein
MVDLARSCGSGTSTLAPLSQKDVNTRPLTARKMSMREMAVPKSLEAQRIKANMLPGAMTRRRLSRICSLAW